MNSNGGYRRRSLWESSKGNLVKKTVVRIKIIRKSEPIPIAVKYLISKSQASLQDAQCEYNTLQVLNGSSNIIKPIHFFKDQGEFDHSVKGVPQKQIGCYYLIVMEAGICSLENLLSAIENSQKEGKTIKISINDILRMFEDVCTGVMEAHSKGVAHLDIKPANILVIEKKDRITKLLEDIVYKLGDFGISVIIENSQLWYTKTKNLSPGGTPPQMAPEAYNCYSNTGSNYYDLMRTDIFSVGYTFDEILKRVPNFNINWNTKNEIYELISKMKSDIPEKRPDIYYCLQGIKQIEEKQTNENRLLTFKSPQFVYEMCCRHSKEKVEALIEIESARNNVEQLIENQIDFGYYQEALFIAQIGLTFLQKKNINNLDLAYYLNVLGDCQNHQGKHDLSLENHKRSLKIRLDCLGENHPKVANSQNNIAVCQNHLEKQDSAIENFQRSLKIRLDCYGENHPQVASALSNIAICQANQEKYDLSLELHQRSLKIRLQSLGENHPDVATSQNNIANFYHKKRNNNLALELHQRSLKIRLDSLGKNHPDVASSQNNIANCLNEQGNYDLALENLQKSLEIMLDCLGENHPEVARLFMLIGLIYELQGNVSNALKNFENAKQIFLQTFGSNHRNFILASESAFRMNVQIFLKQYDL